MILLSYNGRILGEENRLSKNHILYRKKVYGGEKKLTML